MRIVVAGGGTGGHLYPGLAIARALVRLEPRVQPFFVGAERGIEKDVLPSTEFEHELLDLHPLYRTKPLRNLRTLRGGVAAWSRLGALYRALQPRTVLGTGGYAAGLALGRANASGIPTALQEQNSFPGLTMRFFARWAREVYLGFPEAAAALRHGKHTEVVDTGNPIEPPPAVRAEAAFTRARWNFPRNGGPVLLVVGGSQGARAINDAVASIVKPLNDEGVFVIWATGAAHYSDYEHLESDRTRVRPYLSPIAEAYAAADFALCRAGAITTAELCAWGIPSLIVPLPTAAADHQTANARALARAGCSLLLLQSELTAERLFTDLRVAFSDTEMRSRMRAAALARGRPDAAETIAERLLAMMDVK